MQRISPSATRSPADEEREKNKRKKAGACGSASAEEGREVLEHRGPSALVRRVSRALSASIWAGDFSGNSTPGRTKARWR